MHEMPESLRNRLARHHESGGKSVAYAGTHFPEELAESLDLLPIPLLQMGEYRDPELEDRWIDDKEEADTRTVFLRMMRGDPPGLSALVCTRALDHAHYFLRETLRVGVWPGAVPIHLFDMIAMEGESVAAYNRDCMYRLAAFLERVAQRGIDPERLRQAAADRAVRRAFLNRIAELRRSGAITGASAFEAMLTGEEPGRKAADGARLLLVASKPLQGNSVHQYVEASGWTVADEEDGSGRFDLRDGPDLSGDPLEALADHYASLPSALAHPRDRRLGHLAGKLDTGRIDAVLCWMDSKDLRLGWDYPALRDQFEARGIPTEMVRADPETPKGRDAIIGAAAALHHRTVHAG